MIVAWASRLLHSRQVEHALAISGHPAAPDGDPDLLRHQNLERVTDPASPRLTGRSPPSRSGNERAMATAVLDEALHIAADPERSLIEAMAAAQAAHQVRHDLIASSELPVVQRQLVAALERLGEPAAGACKSRLLHWATHQASPEPLIVTGWPATRPSAVHPPPQEAEQPLAADLIAEAVAGGASLGLEARIWAVVELLRTGDQREAYLHLADQAVLP